MKASALTIGLVWAAVSLLLVGRATAEPPPDPRLEKIFADWQNRRERMKTVRYRVTGQHTRPKGTFTDSYTGKSLGPDAPPHDITWPKRITLLLEFQTSRYRLQEDEQPYSQTQGLFPPRGVVTTVFDSGELSSLIQRAPGTPADMKKPDVVVLSGNMRGMAFRADYWPFFLGHGIVASADANFILPGRFAKALEKEVYHVHGEGVFANRSCVVLRTQARKLTNVSFDELWVDLARDSAVLRQVIYVNNKIWTDLQVNYQETRVGWLPQDWTISNTHANDVIFSIDHMHIDEVEIDPMITDADFRVDVKPGMIVQRTSLPGSQDQITVPKSNPDRPLFRVTQNGSLQAVKGPEPRSLWPYYFGGGTVIIFCAGSAVYYWWRRKKLRSAT
jgi:hypothetical protein